VECQKCQGAEKSHIVSQAKEAIHLPKKLEKKEKEKEKVKKQDTQDKDTTKMHKKGKHENKKKEEGERQEDAQHAPAQDAQHAPANMTDAQVAEAREEALAKLEKPLEKMKVKELLALMEERGVECQKCQGAEKSHIVSQVKGVMHLAKVDKKAKAKKEKKQKEDKEKQDRKDNKAKRDLEKLEKNALDAKQEAQDEADANAASAAAADMTEEQRAAAREEVLAKLETPLEKMKIKQLLGLLEERGRPCLKCKGAEKSHIVSQVLEAIHLPIVPKKKAPKGKDKPEDVEDIMSKLKGMPGMENIKVFGRDDMDKMMKDKGKYEL